MPELTMAPPGVSTADSPCNPSVSASLFTEKQKVTASERSRRAQDNVAVRVRRGGNLRRRITSSRRNPRWLTSERGSFRCGLCGSGFWLRLAALLKATNRLAEAEPEPPLTRCHPGPRQERASSGEGPCVSFASVAAFAVQAFGCGWPRCSRPPTAWPSPSPRPSPSPH
jgi:hypothetical protein